MDRQDFQGHESGQFRFMKAVFHSRKREHALLRSDDVAGDGYVTHSHCLAHEQRSERSHSSSDSCPNDSISLHVNGYRLNRKRSYGIQTDREDRYGNGVRIQTGSGDRWRCNPVFFNGHDQDQTYGSAIHDYNRKKKIEVREWRKEAWDQGNEVDNKKYEQSTRDQDQGTRYKDRRDKQGNDFQDYKAGRAFRYGIGQDNEDDNRIYDRSTRDQDQGTRYKDKRDKLDNGFQYDKAGGAFRYGIGQGNEDDNRICDRSTRDQDQGTRYKDKRDKLGNDFQDYKAGRAFRYGTGQDIEDDIRIYDRSTRDQDQGTRYKDKRDKLDNGFQDHQAGGAFRFGIDQGNEDVIRICDRSTRDQDQGTRCMHKRDKQYNGFQDHRADQDQGTRYKHKRDKQDNGFQDHKAGGAFRYGSGQGNEHYITIHDRSTRYQGQGTRYKDKRYMQDIGFQDHKAGGAFKYGIDQGNEDDIRICDRSTRDQDQGTRCMHKRDKQYNGFQDHKADQDQGTRYKHKRDKQDNGFQDHKAGGAFRYGIGQGNEDDIRICDRSTRDQGQGTRYKDKRGMQDIGFQDHKAGGAFRYGIGQGNEDDNRICDRSTRGQDQGTRCKDKRDKLGIDYQDYKAGRAFRYGIGQDNEDDQKKYDQSTREQDQGINYRDKHDKQDNGFQDHKAGGAFRYGIDQGNEDHNRVCDRITQDQDQGTRCMHNRDKQDNGFQDHKADQDQGTRYKHKQDKQDNGFQDHKAGGAFRYGIGQGIEHCSTIHDRSTRYQGQGTRYKDKRDMQDIGFQDHMAGGAFRYGIGQGNEDDNRIYDRSTRDQDQGTRYKDKRDKLGNVFQDHNAGGAFRYGIGQGNEDENRIYDRSTRDQDQGTRYKDNRDKLNNGFQDHKAERAFRYEIGQGNEDDSKIHDRSTRDQDLGTRYKDKRDKLGNGFQDQKEGGAFRNGIGQGNEDDNKKYDESTRDQGQGTRYKDKRDKLGNDFQDHNAGGAFRYGIGQGNEDENRVCDRSTRDQDQGTRYMHKQDKQDNGFQDHKAGGEGFRYGIGQGIKDDNRIHDRSTRDQDQGTSYKDKHDKLDNGGVTTEAAAYTCTRRKAAIFGELKRKQQQLENDSKGGKMVKGKKEVKDLQTGKTSPLLLEIANPAATVMNQTNAAFIEELRRLDPKDEGKRNLIMLQPKDPRTFKKRSLVLCEAGTIANTVERIFVMERCAAAQMYAVKGLDKTAHMTLGPNATRAFLTRTVTTVPSSRRHLFSIHLSTSADFLFDEEDALFPVVLNTYAPALPHDPTKSVLREWEVLSDEIFLNSDVLVDIFARFPGDDAQRLTYLLSVGFTRIQAKQWSRGHFLDFVEPGFMDGMKSMSHSLLNAFGKIGHFLSTSLLPFAKSKSDSCLLRELGDYSTKLAKKLGLSDCEAVSFQGEAMTFAIGDNVGFHYDSENCDLGDRNYTAVASRTYDLTKQPLLGIDTFAKLQAKGIDPTSVKVTCLLYTRKICGNKMNQAIYFQNSADELTKSVADFLTGPSIHDYLDVDMLQSPFSSWLEHIQEKAYGEQNANPLTFFIRKEGITKLFFYSSYLSVFFKWCYRFKDRLEITYIDVLQCAAFIAWHSNGQFLFYSVFTYWNEDKTFLPGFDTFTEAWNGEWDGQQLCMFELLSLEFYYRTGMKRSSTCFPRYQASGDLRVHPEMEGPCLKQARKKLKSSLLQFDAIISAIREKKMDTDTGYATLVKNVKGVGHFGAMHSIHFSALFGLIPYKYFLWSTVSNEGSFGSGRYIKQISPQGVHVRKHFDALVRNLQKHGFGSCFPVYVENCLCLLDRIRRDKVKKELVFLDVGDRDSCELRYQNFFKIDKSKTCPEGRLKFFSDGEWVNFKSVVAPFYDLPKLCASTRIVLGQPEYPQQRLTSVAAV
jgi:hypothetical protein